MKFPALLAAALLQATTHTAPEPQLFQYTRAISVAPGDPTSACAPLDAAVYIHSQPALADLRLFTTPLDATSQEVPYVLTLSETSPTADVATIINRGVRGRHIVFDLEMPPRPYTHVVLDLAAENFVINARVTGLRRSGDPAGTYLGTFTLFDLASQALARNTTLPLSESTFPILHVDLEVIPNDSAGHTPATASTPIGAAIVRAATVPPSREAETIYTTVATSTDITQRGRESTATFTVPSHLPVERVAFDLAPNPPNFSRSVTIRARAQSNADAQTEPLPEILGGDISRVKLTQRGQHLNMETLSVPGIVGSNAQTAAQIEVAVQNGDDRPVPIRAVRLEMRERRLCFDIAASPVALLYGNPVLHAPQYDLSRLFNPAAPLRKAILEAELPNALYRPALERSSFTERHPALLWIALFAVIALLGLTALRTAKRLP